MDFNRPGGLGGTVAGGGGGAAVGAGVIFGGEARGGIGGGAAGWLVEVDDSAEEIKFADDANGDMAEEGFLHGKGGRGGFEVLGGG